MDTASAAKANSTAQTIQEAEPRNQQRNGELKRHAPPSLHPPVAVTYRDCQKNHAASMGGHAVDGCGEFMPAPGADPSDPTSLKCAACGCHRNFHRRESDDAAPDFMSLHRYQPHEHRHPRRGDSGGSPNDSPSPPPISSVYFPPSAPAHILLALSHGGSAPIPAAVMNPPRSISNSRKRFRTKFTQDQKDRMLELAERVDWKMQKKDEELIKESCGEIGVERGVFKVWMHNNKSTLGKKDRHRSPPSAAGEEEQRPDSSKEEINDGTNGSSSSS